MEFEVVLAGGGPGGDVPVVEFPHDVRRTFGTGGRVPVRVTINAVTFRGSLAPMGGGSHVVGIRKALAAEMGVAVGDRVRVRLERDDEPRTVEAPPDLEMALASNPAALAGWERSSYTHRKEHVEAILESKKPETRERRVARAVEMLAERSRGGR